MAAKLGSVVPDAAAAAQASGAARATAAQASERSQSLMARLSSGMFSTVQPMSVPDTNAIAAIANHRPGVNATAAPRRAPRAAANNAAASATPPPACHRHAGWLETAAPQLNLGWRS